MRKMGSVEGESPHSCTMNFINLNLTLNSMAWEIVRVQHISSFLLHVGYPSTAESCWPNIKASEFSSREGAASPMLYLHPSHDSLPCLVIVPEQPSGLPEISHHHQGVKVQLEFPRWYPRWLGKSGSRHRCVQQFSTGQYQCPFDA